MGLISTLKSLLAPAKQSTGSAPSVADAIEYNGYQITPAPIKSGHMYRVCAHIRKGEQSHQLIRADEMADSQTCIEVSLRKAREMIDQQGDNIFSRP